MSKLSKYNLIPANTRCPFHDGCSRVRTSQCLHFGDNTAHDFHCPHAAFLDEYLESTGKAEPPEQIKLETSQSDDTQEIHPSYSDFDNEFTRIIARLWSIQGLYGEVLKHNIPSAEQAVRAELCGAVDTLARCVRTPIDPNSGGETK